MHLYFYTASTTQLVNCAMHYNQHLSVFPSTSQRKARYTRVLNNTLTTECFGSTRVHLNTPPAAADTKSILWTSAWNRLNTAVHPRLNLSSVSYGAFGQTAAEEAWKQSVLRGGLEHVEAATNLKNTKVIIWRHSMTVIWTGHYTRPERLTPLPTVP